MFQIFRSLSVEDMPRRFVRCFEGKDDRERFFKKKEKNVYIRAIGHSDA